MIKGILIATLLLIISSTGYAGSNRVTPYGDYCKECTSYGTCRNVLPLNQAIAAIERYYKDKGYTMGKVWHKGRFIKAEIYKNNKLVDKVLFDRKTSRIRSIMY